MDIRFLNTLQVAVPYPLINVFPVVDNFLVILWSNIDLLKSQSMEKFHIELHFQARQE
jgi:hypothetical protein